MSGVWHTTYDIIGTNVKRRQGYVFRLTPNAAQESLLRQFIGCSRLVWNTVLSENEYRYAEGDPLPIGRKSFCGRLLELKAKYFFLKDAASQPLQQTLNDLVKAYERAFDPKLTAKMPTFKKKQHVQRIRFPQGFRVENKRVSLPKIGWIPFRHSARTMKRKLEGKVTSVTVKLNAGLWYVSFATESKVGDPIHPMMGEVVGIDLGVNRWAALSDGTLFEGVNAFKKHEARLSSLQQNLAKRVKFSKNWTKIKRKIIRLHAKIANIRKDQIHKASSTISKNHAVVIKEDLRVVDMTASAKGTITNPGTNVAAKSGLNRRIQDQGWGELDRQLDYKLKWLGGLLLRVNPSNTSRECNECHHISKDNRLTQESFLCVKCNHAANADTNAARIIEGRAGWVRIVCESRKPCAA
jgi:putative transposase